MKNLKITNKFQKNGFKLVLAGLGITVFLTGCGSNEKNSDETVVEIESVAEEESEKEKAENTNNPKVKEGILVIGDEEFLIEYISYSDRIKSDKIDIELADGTWISTTSDNFYMYDKNSETMNKIKQLIIEEDHIIK